MVKRKLGIYQFIITAVVILMAALLTSCALEKEDETPPTTPVLTILSVNEDSVELAWSESYDDVGVDEYRLYRNNSVLAKVKETEYEDRDVEIGGEYEYYVVAYDKAGNRSPKSIKQSVTISGEKSPQNQQEPQAQQGTPDAPQAGQSEFNLKKISKSTIKLYTLDDNFNVIAMGSGTIINKDGYILTNFHCVGENGRLYNSDGYVAIAITDDVKKNIQPQYIAQYRYGVENLDLAVIKIVSDLNWNAVSARDLNLSPITISDSDKVELGDIINILGYPAVGGETITFTAGYVSGFIDEDGDSEIDWIKTDAIVNHGNSGGTAINNKGEMIGVPTAKIAGPDNDIMFYLKPINQALPILENAIALGDEPALPTPQTPGPGKEQPGSKAEISITGRLVDSYTQRPIRGGIFIILEEGVTIREFAYNPQEWMILAYGESDRNGIFVCDYIPAGASYSVLAYADGYLPIAEDYALEIPADWYDDVDLGDIYLETEY
ncbi:MAG: trypsin-like serine protease [Clostridiaceae bacterium]|nr:trypsin-like serine protease [Clostridiaceae bacterium]